VKILRRPKGQLGFDARAVPFLEGVSSTEIRRLLEPANPEILSQPPAPSLTKMGDGLSM